LSDLLLLTQKKTCLPLYFPRTSESPLSLIGTSSNRSLASVGFLQKPPNSTVIPFGSTIPPFAVAAHPPSSIQLHPLSSIPAVFSLAPYSTHSQKENNHALHAVVMGAVKQSGQINQT
jgi:hypothetical protein